MPPLRCEPAGLWLPQRASDLVVPCEHGLLGPNLLTNGHGEYGDTTGWTTGFTWAGSGGANGDACFRVGTTIVLSQKTFPLNPLTDSLYGAIWDRRDEDTSRPLYAGVACVSAYGEIIRPAMCHRLQNTHCTLFENYTAGSTTMKVTPPANDVSGLSALAIQANISSDDLDLPVMAAQMQYVTSVTKNVDHWVLTLSSGLSQSYSAGTLCAFSQSGDSYTYFLGSGITPPLTWEKRVATILPGVNDRYTAPVSNQYRRGTVAVRFVCFTSGGSGSYNTHIDGMELRRIY